MIDWKAPRRWAAVACLLAYGCSTMREIPRGEYAAEPQRENVKVQTRSGAKYDFDRVRVQSDSLFGDQRVDTEEGSFEEYRTTPLALDDVTAISVRKLDWYRIGLVAGVAAAVALAAVLTQQKDSSTPPSGGGCPKCP